MSTNTVLVAVIEAIETGFLFIQVDGGDAGPPAQNAWATLTINADAGTPIALNSSAATYSTGIPSPNVATWKFFVGDTFQAGFVSAVAFTGSPGWATLACTWGVNASFEGYDNGSGQAGAIVGSVTNSGILKSVSTITLSDTVLTATEVALSWADTGVNASYTIKRNGALIATVVGTTVYIDQNLTPSTAYAYIVTGVNTAVASNTLNVVTLDETQEFNCDCTLVSPYASLQTLETRMLIRLGYPNQTANPPPGMLALIDEFLRDAQRQIYRQVQRAALRTERFFRWTMVPGLRYYAVNAAEGGCGLELDPYKVTWVGFEDLNKAWYRLDKGIPPEYYTRANINFGWPTRYEIRSCIEIFPAPQAAYTLWIKGDIGLAPLVAGTDLCTIDDEAVFLLALGMAKTHMGQKDASAIMTQAGNYVASLVAGSHGTARYVPRTGTDNPMTPPRFLPLGSDQA